MIWQDVVFGVGTAVFSIALIPTLRDKQKPALLTSIPTAVILYVFAITSSTLNLRFAMIMQLVSATIWSALAWQRYRQNQVKSKL